MDNLILFSCLTVWALVFVFILIKLDKYISDFIYK